MASTTPQPELTRRQQRDLIALANGSLDPARRVEVERWVASTPGLRELFERERRAAALLREARTRDRAPDALRARIAAQRPSRAVRVRRRGLYGASLAGTLAAIAAIVGLALPAGSPGAPSVSEAAALAVRGPSAPAPAPDPRDPGVKLRLSNGSVYFPDFSGRFGWRAVGQRRDRIGNRVALTVFYMWRGHRVAYTIVSAPALSSPAASATTMGGVQLRTLRLDRRLVVTWRRQNHTCVLSGSDVGAKALWRLAAWRAPAS